jgi:hypothetical protein
VGGGREAGEEELAAAAAAAARGEEAAAAAGRRVEEHPGRPKRPSPQGGAQTGFSVQPCKLRCATSDPKCAAHMNLYCSLQTFCVTPASTKTILHGTPCSKEHFYNSPPISCSSKPPVLHHGSAQAPGPPYCFS